MKMREKLFEIIDSVQKHCAADGTYCCDCEYQQYKDNTCWKHMMVDAIIDSELFCNSPDAMDEQEPNVYKWTAIEDDGYTHSEYGIANNMFDAFVKATEYSPDYHKKVVIEKIPYDELKKDLKEFYKDVLSHKELKGE